LDFAKSYLEVEEDFLMKEYKRYNKNIFKARLFTTVFSILIMLVCISPCHAATYYLDAVSGDDLNPGTISEPWKTLPRAMITYSGSGNRMAYGDTVMIRDGNYGPFILEPQDLEIYTGDVKEALPADTEWVTYKAAPGSEDVFFSRISLNYTYAKDIRLIAHVFDGINIINENGSCVLLHYGIGLRLRNMYLSGNKHTIDYEPGDRTHYNVVRLRYTHGDVKIENCEIEAGYDGIYLHNPNNVEIKGCDIHDCGCDKIMSGGGRNVVIENNRFHGRKYLVPGSHPDCIQFYTAADKYGDSARMTNLIIRGNMLYDHPSQGIWTGGSYLENVLFENNLIYNCGNYEWRVYSVHGGLIRNNTIIANKSGQTGFVIYGPEYNSDITVVNNIFAVPYTGSESVLTYHDYNIFVPSWNGSPGYNEPNSVEYASMEEAAADLCVDPVTKDYRLKAGSPAIDFGDPANAPLIDITGRERIGYTDAGCYEFEENAKPQSVLYGDVSLNGYVTALDAAICARFVVGLITLSEGQKELADMDKNGVIIAQDAGLIARKATLQ